MTDLTKMTDEELINCFADTMADQIEVKG